jgi:EAL domain-containing protein (putative c-di-GMP-specific phosphodiesterase class I)
MALYRAKGLGKNRYALFEWGMHDEVTQRLAMSAALGQAIERDELQVRYQPVVDLVSGHVRGVEALVRWQHSVLSDIGPAEFIPIAEQTGLIVPIGRWVLQEACTQLARWERLSEEGHDITVSVNVSARQLQEPEFVNEVRDLVARHGITPSHLVFELTESVLIEDSASVTATLDDLKKIGVRLAIDDFGTGYSSMNYVSRFPIDVLKIDKSFVSSMASSPTSTALVAAMVQLANSLGIVAIAEGVEEPEQVDVLRRLGCRLGQGYLWSVPVPASRVEHLIVECVQLVH